MASVELFGGAEEEGAVNAKDGDVRGDVFVLQDVGLAVGEVLGCDGRDSGRFGDAVDVEERGEGHADSTATVRSANTVRAKVVTQTAMSVFERRRMVPISRHSPML